MVCALLVLAVAISFLTRAFVAGVYFIPSGSMENTLRIGDRVVVDKLEYRLHGIHRGDIVVFDGRGSFTAAAPRSEQDFIKRVIGLPGDRVVCCDAQGRITVNGVPLDEPYLYPGNPPSDVRFDVVVPPGRLWVMGDHRSVSADSRSHLGDPGGGTVAEDRVIGRARLVIWPLPHARTLPVPATFDQPALTSGTSAAGSSLGVRAPPRHFART